MAKQNPRRAARLKARKAAKAAFGQALHSARERKGMTERELAQHLKARGLNASQSMVSTWETGQRIKNPPSRSVVFEMERILSLAPGTLSINAGYLPGEASLGDPVSVRDAVLTDGSLSQSSKDLLLRVYDGFVSAGGNSGSRR